MNCSQEDLYVFHFLLCVQQSWQKRSSHVNINRPIVIVRKRNVYIWIVNDSLFNLRRWLENQWTESIFVVIPRRKTHTYAIYPHGKLWSHGWRQTENVTQPQVPLTGTVTFDAAISPTQFTNTVYCSAMWLTREPLTSPAVRQNMLKNWTNSRTRCWRNEKGHR